MGDFQSFNSRELEDFGGLNSLSSNTLDVPAGEATDLLNVDFISGNTYTRDGLTTVATLSGKIIGIKEYVLLDPASRRVLALNDAGTLSVETGAYTFSTVSTDIAEATVQSALRFRGQTLFGREYMAFSQNGVTGAALPYFYDDTALFRVGPDGPGAAAAVADGGAGAPGLDAGLHYLRVFARTSSGYWTALGPAVSWTAAGSKVASVSNIPTGPTNWTARVLAFSPVGDSVDFYFIEGSSMVINDNTTTTATCDFTDSTLIAGTVASSVIDPSVDLLRQVTLPAQANVMAYNRRLAWTGERNTLGLNGDNGFRNLGFNGGVQATNANLPCGWTERVAGESVTTDATVPGTILKVLGTGAQRGVLQNIGNASTIIPAGVKLNCRVRAKRFSSGAVSGTFHVWLGDSGVASNAPPAASTFGLQISMSSLSATEWRVIDAQMMAGTNVLPTSTWVMRIGTGDGSGTSVVFPNNNYILIQYIEVYPANQPTSPSLVRWSKVDDPEAYDGLTGIMNVNENDGQRLNAMFRLKQACFFVKDHSLYATQDNGQTEPNEWSIDPVSDTVGCLSPNGVAVSDTWALICARAGVHLFNGSTLQNVSNKIKTTWQRINWTYGYKIWILLDVEEKRFEIGVPLDGATEVNYIIYCRYTGDTPLAATNPMTPSYTTNWSIWTSLSSSACFSERSDGTRALLEGSNDNSGKIARRDSTNHTDYFVSGVAPGTGYTSYYQSYFFGDITGIQLFGYCVTNAYGSGTLQVDLYSPDSSIINTLAIIPLTATSYRTDTEMIAQFTMPRAALRFTAAAGSSFSLTQTAVYTKAHPWLGVRGTLVQGAS